jgi:hypothetical protein
MYEHAYHLEFGANASAYIAAFMRNIDWSAAKLRYEDAIKVAPPRPLEQKQFADVPSISVEEVREMLKSGTSVQIIDTRPKHYTTKAQDIMEGAVWRDPERAGVVAGKGSVLVANRGGGSMAWVDARTLETRTVLNTGPRPNGAAIVSSLQVAVVACIGDDTHAPQLQVLGLEGDRRWSVDLPGRPRWCVVDAKEERVFLAIRNPSMEFAANLPELNAIHHWPLPSDGAHGMDINHAADLLYVACDGGSLVEVMSGLDKRSANGRSPVFRMRPFIIRQMGSCMSPLKIRG